MFISKEQQIEGLTFISKHVSMREFSVSTAVLVENDFISKSERYNLVKMMRHIKGISWEKYKKIMKLNLG